ncbi:hypothetical protein BDD43_0740 [Mucilaginibacter gracilis]|uniref:Uncharacterized protein n=2 Tax=Mucilaginibacter TaxID=423349 RepID=H1YI37_9SPHI|nr:MULTISPECIES: hypothetical protein [Mucilaginibacter]EHQ26472.1 hypothetical protein Mucpa_2342 [Mucilaginibacter paludis DSM 18603]RKR80615.1 hypothetical protein BDD43_0740 [Mucilaginibacter gracilis]
MLKKLTSNRDPKDTLLSELKKEFGSYYTKAAGKGQHFVDRFPRFVFSSMIVLMLVSAGLSFTVFRNKEPVINKKAPAAQKSSSLTTGLGQLLQTGESLRETIALKRQVDSLIAKKTLTNADSAALEKALDKLQQLNKQFKP